MHRFISLVVLGAALLLLGASGVSSADRPSEKKPVAKSSSHAGPAKHGGEELERLGAEAAIERALACPTEMNFTDAPLSDAILFLKDHHGIEIQLDGRALTDAGVETSTPITKTLKGISLRSALNLMLRDLNLRWTIQDEVLLITTPEEVQQTLTTRVLDVGDLVICCDGKGEPWNDYDSLIRVIQSTVRPNSWHDAGGPGAIMPANLGAATALVISQTYDAHDEIAKLIADIRAVAKKTPDAGPPRRDRPGTSHPAERHR